jgi:peptidoglycan/LPS O-acetylase OafA/YrhL
MTIIKINSRLVGIDSLRYILALWVFFTHGGRPPFFEGSDAVFNSIDKLYGWAINGQAAVIGFFIISGLCIHYPNIAKDRINLGSFYSARFLRLSLPVISMLLIAYLVGFKHSEGLLRAVPIWTIYCEGFYYLVYPVLHWVFKRVGTTKVTLFFSLISTILLFLWSDDRNMMFHELGNNDFLNWKSALLAFPCWLSGCLIADVISSKNRLYQVTKNNLLKWRVGALVLSTITFPLYRLGLFLGLVKLPLLGFIFSSQFNLLMFGLYAFFWIKKEVIYHNNQNSENQPNKILELMGKWSFSLYIIHTLVIWSFDELKTICFPGYLITWILLLIIVHIATYIYYIGFEKPSHNLSRFISKRLK